MSKKWLVLGATSAIAEATLRIWAQNGDSFYLVARNEEKLESIAKDLLVRGAKEVVTQCENSSNTACHQDIIAEADRKMDKINGLFIAYGSLTEQVLVQSDYEKQLDAFNINALSVISWVTIVSDLMLARQEGTICVIGSVAGDRGRQSNYVYGAAKGMLSIYLQGLANRCKMQGVDVCIIKPGFVDTPMTQSIDNKGLLWAKPDQIAKGIVSAVKRGRTITYLPAFWWLIMAIIKSIPSAIFNKLKL